MPREKVRLNAVYRYEPAGWDLFMRPASFAAPGQLVRVIHPYGCPKPGTMNHCHIADASTGEFLGLVHISSLSHDS